jgi:hypothetical protein
MRPDPVATAPDDPVGVAQFDFWKAVRGLTAADSI